MDRPTIEILPTADDAAIAAARRMAGWITDARVATGRAHVALAGGQTPRGAYAHLAGMMDGWTDVHLWFGDERMLPTSDPDANAAMASASLVVPAGIPPAQVHEVRTDLAIADAVADYATRLRAALPLDPEGRPVFDVVMLGLGEDGHVASLFPGRPQLDDRQSVCVSIEDAPKPPAQRISLSLGTINAAHNRLVLTVGAGKAEAVCHVTSGRPDPGWPASLLTTSGTVFVLDVTAAAALTD